MITLRSLATIFGILNSVAILVFLVSSGAISSESEEAYLQEQIESRKFVNKDLALAVLRELDSHEIMPDNYFMLGKTPRKFFNKTYFGLKRNPEYCNQVQERLVNDPSFIFEEMNFVTNFLPDTLVRHKLMPLLGRDLMPHVSYVNLTEKQRETPLFLFPEQANIFYFSNMIHQYHEYGHEIACTFQAYSHVPGVEALCRKDYASNSVAAYTKKFEDRPQCYDGSKFFPKTINLFNKTDCQNFFKLINSEQYKKQKEEQTILFIRKAGVGAHQGKTVFPVDEEQERKLREEYKNGSLCGRTNKSDLIQSYIQNPLLVEGHKFDFRIYAMIASSNPLIVYYHDGFLRVSLFEYDVTSKEKGMHLTNTAQSLKVIEKAKKQGMNETELRNFQMWNLTRFTKYLVSIGKVESIDWLDEYLRPSLQHAIQHAIRMSQEKYYTASPSFDLLGMDFMLDEDLNLWFLESNIGPALEGSNDEKERMISKLVKDQLEIVTAYLKSRTKRAIKYINWLGQTGLAKFNENGELKISKLDQRKKEFKAILKNYIDEEFEISSDNGWVKIIDENLEGLGRYNGMFNIECFDF